MQSRSMEPKVILLVEDNPSDVDLTRRAFQKSHIANSLIVAEDGRQALDYLLESRGEPAPLPALILLDLKLPLIDGLEVLRQIREDRRTRRIPVVVLTSSDEESDLAAAYDLGANSYIQKPVDFNRFAEAVRSLGLYWLVLNESPPVGKP
ncbi:MAG: response regulator [Syntrophobacteraceae bacterium]